LDHPRAAASLTHSFLSIPGWLTEPEGLALQELARAPGDGEVVEIGSYMGRSTAFLAQGLKERGSGVVHAVDHFRGSPEMYPGGANPQPGFQNAGHSTYPEFEQHLRKCGLREYVQAHVGQSMTVADGWKNAIKAPIRLLFIDGEHSYDAIAADCDAWGRFLKPGGTVCFHDYGSNGWPDVKRYVDERVRAARTRLVEQLMICMMP
jgi:predicted O-methyltransferase YrrM